MKFYKVISKKVDPWSHTHENIFSYRLDKGVRVSEQYIADSLWTISELTRLYGINEENINRFPFLQPVDVKKNKTHWFFGCRFEDDRPLWFSLDNQPLEKNPVW